MHAKVAGYVKAIYVDVGDRVSAGQLLAVLEIPELQDDMATAEAAVKRSQRGGEPRAGRSRARPSRRTRWRIWARRGSPPS